MSASSLVEYGFNGNAITTVNEKMKCTTVRLLTAKEYKTKRGLKGNAGTIAYNAYLRAEGQANPEGLIKKLASGDLILRSVKDFPGSMQFGVIKKSALRDPVGRVAAPVAMTREELLAQLAALDAKTSAAGRLDPVK